MQLSLGNLSYDDYSKKIMYPIYNQNEKYLRVKLPEMLFLSQDNNFLSLEIKDEKLIRDTKLTFDTIDSHIIELLKKRKEIPFDKINYIGMRSLIVSQYPSFVIRIPFHSSKDIALSSSKLSPVIIIKQLLINSQFITINIFTEN